MRLWAVTDALSAVMGTCSDATVRAVPFPSENSAPSGTSSEVMGTVFAVTDAFSAVLGTFFDFTGYLFFVVLKHSLRNEGCNLYLRALVCCYRECFVSGMICRVVTSS